MKFTTEDRSEFYDLIKYSVANGIPFQASIHDGISSPVYEITFY